MDKLKIISLNVNGLNSPTKRSKIFNQLLKTNADIICLQETHVKSGQEHLLNAKKLGTNFAVSAPVKKKGLVTYVRNPNISATVLENDPDARFQILKITVSNQASWTLANIYAPNNGKAEF